MYPGAQVFWAKWSPPHERSRLVAFAFGGKGTEIEININQRCVQQRERSRVLAVKRNFGERARSLC